jgi:hypothetical protein
MAIQLPNPPVERPTKNSEETVEDQRQLGTWRNELYRMFQYNGTTTATPGLLASGAIGSVAITVIGCLANRAQTVLIGAPASIEAGLMWNGYISANGVVTVRVQNTTAAPITPASGQWTARVMP